MENFDIIDFDQINTEDSDDFSDVDSLLQITSPLFNQENIFRDISIEKYILDGVSYEVYGIEEISNNGIDNNNYEFHCLMETANENEEEISSDETKNITMNAEQNRLIKNISRKSNSKNYVNNNYSTCLKEKPDVIKVSKLRSDKKYRSKMRNLFTKLGQIIVGKNIDWKKKELLDLSIKHIMRLKKSNEKITLENERMKKILESIDESHSIL
jgi:hypothetical protein